MKRRIESLKRMADLQQRMSDLKKWRLAQLEAEKRALGEAHLETIAALDRELAAFGPLAAVATRRARRLEKDIAAAATACEAHKMQVLEQAARSSAIDHVVRSADARQKDHEARAELTEIVDGWLASRGSSSG
jgi:hypothetical protein